jgi:hypothetical protein
MVLVAVVAVVWLSAGSAMPDRSKVVTQKKWDILAF